MNQHGQSITLGDYAQFGTLVRELAPDHPARVRAYSRNLRGLRDYARKSPVVCVITRKDESLPVCGILHVVYADGCIGRAYFRSHAIMLDFVRNRRTWRSAEIRHLSGDVGYLTKPGIIAGGLTK